MMAPQLADPEEVAPYLIHQAGLRASLLRTSFGLAAEECEDLRQELATDCLRRLVNFDPVRSDWRQFVHSVVRNHACVLASRLASRPATYSLDDNVNADPDEAVARLGGDAEEDPDGIFTIELQLDVAHVLTGLTPDQQSIARLLSRYSLGTVRRITRLSTAQLDRKIRRIRAAFLAAGFGPVGEQLRGGAR